MKIYRVRFVLANEDRIHDTYIHAAHAKEALQKLADRFPYEPRQIQIESVDENHGKFIIGSEEKTF